MITIVIIDDFCIQEGAYWLQKCYLGGSRNSNSPVDYAGGKLLLAAIHYLDLGCRRRSCVLLGFFRANRLALDPTYPC